MTIPTRDVTTRSHSAGARPRSRMTSAWHAVTGGIGAVVGLAPHVLHHIGLLTGTALVAGAGGTALFGVIGLLASTPLLLRLYHRFHTWRASAIALAVFAVMFSLSAFVIGPAINGGSDTNSPSNSPTNPPTAPTSPHDQHGH